VKVPPLQQLYWHNRGVASPQHDPISCQRPLHSCQLALCIRQFRCCRQGLSVQQHRLQLYLYRADLWWHPSTQLCPHCLWCSHRGAVTANCQMDTLSSAVVWISDSGFGVIQTIGWQDARTKAGQHRWDIWATDFGCLGDKCKDIWALAADYFSKSLHTLTAVALLPLHQLGLLVEKCRKQVSYRVA